MGKEYKINKLTYVPRQSGGANGYITSYDLYVKKAENDDWTQVVTDGVWASDTKKRPQNSTQLMQDISNLLQKREAMVFATASEFHIHQVLNEEQGSNKKLRKH